MTNINDLYIVLDVNGKEFKEKVTPFKHIMRQRIPFKGIAVLGIVGCIKSTPLKSFIEDAINYANEQERK